MSSRPRGVSSEAHVDKSISLALKKRRVRALQSEGPNSWSAVVLSHLVYRVEIAIGEVGHGRGDVVHCVLSCGRKVDACYGYPAARGKQVVSAGFWSLVAIAVSRRWLAESTVSGRGWHLL